MGRKKLLNRDQVVRVIQNWVVYRGMAPTVEELRQAVGAGSSSTVLRYLRQLEEEGYIERWHGARGLKLLRGVEGTLKTRPVPLVGVVSAGPSMLAEENLETWVRVPEGSLTPPSAQFFLLRVTGNSMNRAEVPGGKIEDGDLVLVRQQPTADPGQVVVALIDGEATIKRLAVGPDYWVLRPESTSKPHHPIVLDKQTVIQGVVCRVLKKGSALMEDQIEGSFNLKEKGSLTP